MAQSNSTIHNSISLMIEISHNTSPFGKSHGQWLSSVQWRIDILRPKPLTASSKSLLMNITASESNCTTTGEALSRLKVTGYPLCYPSWWSMPFILGRPNPLSVWITSNPPSNNTMQQRTTLFQPTEGDCHCLLCDKIWWHIGALLPPKQLNDGV